MTDMTPDHMGDEISDAISISDPDTTLDDSRLSGDAAEVNRLVKMLEKYRSVGNYKLMKYKLANDALQVGLWDMDVIAGDPINPKNKFTWSTKFRRMLGFHDERDFPDLLHSWSDRLHPEDKERTLKAFRDHICDHTGKTPYDLEYRLMLRDGGYRHFRALGTTQRDGAGVPIRVAGALLDIEDRRQAQNQLVAMLDAQPLSATLSRLKGSEVSLAACNQAAVNHFGVESKQDLLDRDFLSFSPETQPDGGDSKAQSIALTRKALEEGKVVFEWTYEAVDGTPLPCEVTLVRIEINHEMFVAAYLRDLRFHKQMMRSVESKNKLLATIKDVAALMQSANSATLRDSINRSLRLIGTCLDLDGTKIWRNEAREDGVYFINHHAWISRFAEENGVLFPVGTGFSYNSRPILKRLFADRSHLCVNVSELQEYDRVFLEKMDVKSLAVMPLYLDDKMWGFMSLDDKREERFFPEDEIQLIQSVGMMMVTAIVSVERAAKANEANERVTMLFDATPLGCLMFDTEYNCVDCNQEAVRLFSALDKADFLSRYHLMLPKQQPGAQPSLPAMSARMESAQDNGKEVFDFICRTLEGEALPVEVSLVPLIPLHGEGRRTTAAYVRDLREEKRMTREINRQNRLLHVTNRIAMLLQTVDEDSILDLLSEGMRLVGHCTNTDRVQIWRNEMVDGALHFVLRHEWLSDVGLQKTPVPSGLKLPHSAKPEWVTLFENGGYINAPFSALPPEDQYLLEVYDIKSIVIIPVLLDGVFWGFFSLDDCQHERTYSANEIDLLRTVGSILSSAVARVEQSTKVRELAHWYRGILNAISLPITVTDKNMNWTFVNTAVERFLGTKLEDMLGKPCSNWNAHICNTPACGIACAKRGEKRTFFRHNENSYQVDVEILKNFEDETSGFIEIVQNITDIEEMTKKQVAAEQASSAKSAFLANMSHEIRTPMNGIIGFCELAIDDDRVSLKAKEYLQKIEGNSKLLLQIVNDILDLSKIESGKMELERIPFNLPKLLRNSIQMAKLAANEKGVEISCHPDLPEDTLLIGDPLRLRQIIDNLLSNAVKFTDKGSVIMAVSAVPLDGGDRYDVSFEIKDTGIGMTPEQTAKVLMPFIQAESGTTRKYGGTGLGLPIVNEIVQMMGSELAVESKPGIGSQFTFRLVFDAAKSASDTSSRRITGSVILSKPQFDADVLLCEDNLMNQEIAVEHLSRVGIRTVVTNNGAKAVEMVQGRVRGDGKPFDLILMDIHMPVLDGYGALAEIRELGVDTPVVAMTANVMTEDIARYLKAGFQSHLGKPFTSQELWRRLLQFLKPTAAALDRTGVNVAKNADLSHRLKDIFVAENREKADEIATALVAGDIELAHRLAHTLKSNSGSLGKANLQKTAALIEAALKENRLADADALLPGLREELNAVLAEIVPPPDAARVDGKGEAVAVDAEWATKLLSQLEVMLKNGDMDCLNLLDDLRRIPETDDLVWQIEHFDFSGASVTLAEKQGGKKNGRHHQKQHPCH